MARDTRKESRDFRGGSGICRWKLESTMGRGEVNAVPSSHSKSARWSKLGVLAVSED